MTRAYFSGSTVGIKCVPRGWNSKEIWDNESFWTRKRLTQCIFQQQPGRQFESFRILFQELNESPGQVAPCRAFRHAQVSENVVHLFVAVVKPMPGFRDEVTGCEAVYEPRANAPGEVLNRILVCGLAVGEHLLAGEPALGPGAGAGRRG